MLNRICSGISAGIMVSIGGCVFLACENRIAGAVLFSVALLVICFKGFSLFTGKVGYIPEKHGREEVSALLLGLLGNLIGTVICGLLIKAALPGLGDSALAICTGKLTQTAYGTFVRGIFCGILMYSAVSIYRSSGSIAGIVFCIPVFILSGFEHSIADMFYFAVSGLVSAKAFGFIWIVIAGNSVGGMLLPLLSLAGRKERADA